MNSIKCPYCGAFIALSQETQRSDDIFIRFSALAHRDFAGMQSYPSMTLTSIWCPSCDEIIIGVSSTHPRLKGIDRFIKPTFTHITPPLSVPEAVKNDYIEACSIVSLSPKASATMSRRCLQGMIRDFWKISKRTLHDEIVALSDKGVSPEIINVLLGFKSIANIGAHPDKNQEISVLLDIGKNEASDLLQMIEYLFEAWYASREKRQALCERISIASRAKALIKNPPTDVPGCSS